MKGPWIAAMLVFAMPALSAAACFDHSIWDKILEANVDEAGFVDYDGVRVNRGGGNFYEYLTLLELAELAGCSEAERTAFWINAYNANVFRQLLNFSPDAVLSKDDPAYSKSVYVANRNISLNDILDRVLRSDPPIKGVSVASFDPRTHFLIASGAAGGAGLLQSAVTADALDRQMDAAAVAYVNQERHRRLEDGQLVVSHLFDWYGQDFGGVGGVTAFLTKHTRSDRRADEEAIDQAILRDYPSAVRYDYDWSINRAGAR